MGGGGGGEIPTMKSWSVNKTQQKKFQYWKTWLLCMERNNWYLLQHIFYSITQVALTLFIIKLYFGKLIWKLSISHPTLVKSGIRGHSKSMFARNFQFLTHPPPFPSSPCSFLFVLHVPSPSPPPSMYVRFSELPSPSSRKKFRDAYDACFEKKSGDEKWEKN